MKKIFFLSFLVTMTILPYQSGIAKRTYNAPPTTELKNHKPPLMEHTTKRPPGWNRGKKKGWRGAPYPPGWSKWPKRKQKKWTGAIDEVNVVIRRYPALTTRRNEIIDAFNQAIAAGVLIDNAKDNLVSALQNDEKRRYLMIDTTQHVLELLK